MKILFRLIVFYSLLGILSVNVHGERSVQSLISKDSNSNGKKSSGILHCKTENIKNQYFEFKPRRGLAGGSRLTPINVCICKENFAGRACNECAIGFYGDDCSPCIRNPVDGIICGVDGICDDGRKGTGKCFCKDLNLDPLKFCESSVNIVEEK